MKANKLLILSGLLFALLTSSCTWVKLTPGGELVSVATSEAVSTCKKIGKTTVSIKSKVIGVKRKSETVENELSSLARNSAAKMGGNTIVPVSETVDGEKTFSVFQCDSI